MPTTACFIPILFLAFVFQNEISCEDSAQSNSDLDNSVTLPVLPSGKRQHAIMRFGKRPAGGHSLIHFGKREEGQSPKHSFLYFGKRSSEPDTQALPDLLKYLQKNRDNSYKRGHTIMRFGKRAGGENHNILRFGKRDDDSDDSDDGYYPGDNEYEEDQKRDGHSMLYFGKRPSSGGHAMLSFGKRPSSGGHTMLSFGKRPSSGGHSMLSFGKRPSPGGHAMLSFGKRDDDDEDIDEAKRAHSMIHFGKRDQDDDDSSDDVEKRGGGGSHSMIHFGKRDPGSEDVTPLFWYPEPSEKRQHSLLRFGKKGSHSMIHFGKREDPKKVHAMIHFGKRSVDSNQSDSSLISGPPQALIRMKRDIDSTGQGPIMSLIRDDEEEDGNNLAYYPPEDIFSPFEVPEDQSGYSEYRYPVKKDASKNVFLRFG